MKKSLNPLIVPIVAALLAGSAAAFAQEVPPEAEGAVAPPPQRSLYEKIYAHYAHLGRDVREEFRDGPCKIERHWERDGDYKETIRCRGPRRD